MYAGVMSAEFENHFKTRFTYAEEKQLYAQQERPLSAGEILDLLKVQQMLKSPNICKGDSKWNWSFKKIQRYIR